MINVFCQRLCMTTFGVYDSNPFDTRVFNYRYSNFLYFCLTTRFELVFNPATLSCDSPNNVPHCVSTGSQVTLKPATESARTTGKVTPSLRVMENTEQVQTTHPMATTLGASETTTMPYKAPCKWMGSDIWEYNDIAYISYIRL